MSFKKAPTESVDFELPPGGTYLGPFLGLIDLGTQEWEWNGKKQSSHKIYFLWELNERNANDYNFIVGMLKAADYYQLDVFLYYVTTFLIPVLVGVRYAKK